MCSIVEQVVQLIPPFEVDQLASATEASKRAVALKPLESRTVSEQLTSTLSRLKKRHSELGEGYWN